MRNGLGIRHFVALLPALTALVSVGCNAPKGDAGSGAKKFKIVGIGMQSDEFFRLAEFGMRDAAAKANVEFLYGNSVNKPEKEAELVNTYAGQGVDAIVISPVSSTGSVQTLKAASDKGIKIVCQNTALAADFATSEIESDQVDLGTQTGIQAAQYIKDKMGGKANVAIVAFKTLIPEQSDARCKGFEDEIKKLPGVKIVAEQDAWLPEPAAAKAGDILTAHPEVDLIWSANEGGTVGSVLAVKNANKAGKIVVFGTDCSDQLIGFLQSQDNILQAITSQRPVEVGSKGVEYAVKALKGESVPKKEILKGICLTRTDPKGVEDFKKKLAEWKKSGS